MDGDGSEHTPCRAALIVDRLRLGRSFVVRRGLIIVLIVRPGYASSPQMGSSKNKPSCDRNGVVEGGGTTCYLLQLEEP